MSNKRCEIEYASISGTKEKQSNIKSFKEAIKRYKFYEGCDSIIYVLTEEN